MTALDRLRQENAELHRELEQLHADRGRELAEAYIAGKGDGILEGLRLAAEAPPAPVLQLVGREAS